MFIPQPRLLLLLVVLSPLWLFLPMVAGVCILILLIISVLDFLSLPKKKTLSVHYTTPAYAFQWQPTSFSINVSNHSSKKINGDLYADIPVSPTEENNLHHIELSSASTLTLSIPILPALRGDIVLGGFLLRLKSPLGLISRDYFWEDSTLLKVYPTAGKSAGALLAYSNKEQTHAARWKQPAGYGDFESLQQFRSGQDLRQIHWKATAKRGALISIQRQQEISCQVLAAVDCGRMMEEITNGFSRLDLALNATTLLCQSAEMRRDNFGVVAFSNKEEACLPISSAPKLSQLYEACYRLTPRPVETDYWQVLGKMLHAQSKRCLIVLFTDVLDRWSSQGLVRNVCAAAERHLVLCVVHKEKELNEALIDTSIYKQGAAAYLQKERRLAIEIMRKGGVHVLEADPETFSEAVIKKYLELRELA